MRTSHPEITNSMPDVDLTSLQSGPPPPSRWLVPAILAIAVLATVVATWSLVQPSADPPAQPSEPAVSAQQSDAAKARVCSAFDIVRKAVSMQTNGNLGTDPVAKEAVAANARLATLGGGAYLLSRLDPATPSELADSVRRFANGIEDIGMNQLVGVPNADPNVATLLNSAQQSSDRIAQMCR